MLKNLRSSDPAVAARKSLALVEDLETKLRAAQGSLVEARQALAASGTAYEAACGENRQAALAARQAHDAAEVDLDIATRTVERLDRELAMAHENVAQENLSRLSATALARSAEFEKLAERELLSMSASARTIIRALVDAEIAREDAIRAGADESDLPHPESFRSVGYRPRKDIETKRTTRWINPWGGAPLSDEQSARVRESDGGAYLVGSSSEPMRLRDKAEFDRIVFLPAERGYRATSLIEALAVPGLLADDPAGWSAPESLHARAVLAHLVALEQAPRPDRSDRRKPEVELRRVQGDPCSKGALPTDQSKDIEMRSVV